MKKILLPLLLAAGAVAPWVAQAHTTVEFAVDVPGIALRVGPPVFGWIAPPIVQYAAPAVPVVQYAPPTVVAVPYPEVDARRVAYPAYGPRWHDGAWREHQWREHEWQQHEWREQARRSHDGRAGHDGHEDGGPRGWERR